MQRKSPVENGHQWRRLWLLALILLAAALRLYDLGTESYWIDEVVMINLTQGSWEPLADSLARARPPLFPLSGFFWVRLVGSSEFAARFLSTAAGILAIPLLYAVGRKLFDKNVALIAAFLLSISLFHIYHAQTYRYYAWVTMMALISYLSFIVWLEQGGRRRFWTYVATSILLFYTHTYSLFVLVAQGLYFLVSWRTLAARRGAWVVSQLLILAGCSFGLRLIYLDIVTGRDVGLSAAIESIGSQQPWWLLPYTVLGKFMFLDFDLFFTQTQLLSTPFAIGMLLFFYIQNQKKSERAGAFGAMSSRAMSTIHSLRNALWTDTSGWLVLLWFLVPLALPFTLQYVVGPSFEPRYTIGALPASAILLAWVMRSVALRKLMPPVAALTALVIVWLPSAWHYYTWDVSEQWAEVTQHVSTHASREDRLMFVGKGARSEGNNHLLDAYQLYAQKVPSLCADGVYDLVNEAKSNEMGQCLQDGHRVWLVMRYHKIDDAHWMQDQVAHYFRAQLVEEYHFTNIRLFLFENRTQTATHVRRID